MVTEEMITASAASRLGCYQMRCIAVNTQHHLAFPVDDLSVWIGSECTILRRHWKGLFPFSASAQKGRKIGAFERKTYFLDKDRCGLVCNDLGEIVHKQRMQSQGESAQVEEGNLASAADADPVVDVPGENAEKIDVRDENDAVDTMLSKFHLDCCGKAPATIQDVEDKQVPEEEFLKAGESRSVATGNGSDATRSLADIAAKMNEIDIETAVQDTSGDQISECSDNDSITRPGKARPWYKAPVYATLIILCGTCSIAIFVLAILLIVGT